MTTPVLLVAHYPLASALESVARHVHGDALDHLLVLDIAADADTESAIQQGIALLENSAGETGALVLTDCFGATPSNIARRIAESTTGCYFVAGVNLPMLLRTLNYRDEAASTLADYAIEGGKKAIIKHQPD